MHMMNGWMVHHYEFWMPLSPLVIKAGAAYLPLLPPLLKEVIKEAVWTVGAALPAATAEAS